MTAETPPPGFAEFLQRRGLMGADEAVWTPLAGGVSADVWRVQFPDRALVVKRALLQLKVPGSWTAPVARSGSEWAWLVEAQRIQPGIAPRPLASDAAAGFLAMEYLPEPAYRTWKPDLDAGRFDAGLAAKVGARLAQLHAATSRSPELMARFDTTDLFHELRLSPYLFAVARRHADVADQIERLAVSISSTRRALVHGDVSPKNILVGPDGPVFLDAECAWYGDPAFDLAFCLNHMLLDGLEGPAPPPDRRAAFEGLAGGYLAGVAWEPPADLERRAAELLPALMLARVDGKSPLPSLQHTPLGAVVRSISKGLLIRPPVRLATVAEAWLAELDGGRP
jgi:aminoglycoside phosphotransferase (APT) family kinase protein